jgi:serine acetyltransferase
VAKICARVTVGRFSIINTGASIDHECVLGKGVHVAPNAVLCGCVEVGDYSFIGANATILPRIKIGANVVIGAGAVVIKDVKNNIVIAGNPGRELYSNQKREIEINTPPPESSDNKHIFPGRACGIIYCQILIIASKWKRQEL